MSVDNTGVRWSKSALPAPGACVSKDTYKPSRPLTNGELMSGGYAPRPPQGYNKNGKKTRPSRMGGGSKYQPPPAPKPSGYNGPGYSTIAKNVQGNVVVMGTNGPIGFIRHDLTQFGTFTFTTDASQAEVFSKSKTPSPTKGFEITSLSQDLPFFGAGQGFSAWPLNNPKPAPVYASFAPVSHSVAPPTDSANPTGQPSESNLWSMDASTGELTAQWGLNSGKYVDMKIFYDVTYGDLNMAQDFDAYTTYFGDIIEAVSFFFVPL